VSGSQDRPREEVKNERVATAIMKHKKEKTSKEKKKKTRNILQSLQRPQLLHQQRPSSSPSDGPVPSSSAYRWEKLSPAEFEQLQDLAACTYIYLFKIPSLYNIFLGFLCLAASVYIVCHIAMEETVLNAGLISEKCARHPDAIKARRKLFCHINEEKSISYIQVWFTPPLAQSRGLYMHWIRGNEMSSLLSHSLFV